MPFGRSEHALGTLRAIISPSLHWSALFTHQLGCEAKDNIMTAGQRIFEQGRQQGIEQGRQQGIEQGLQQSIEHGRQQGLQEMLLHLLRHRFGDAVCVHVEQRIATASLEQLQTWTPRILTATTLDDVLAI